MPQMRPKYVWDYDLPPDWQPETKQEWLWCLQRKINYDDWTGITKEMLKRYFPELKNQLDPGKRKMIELYLEKK